MSQSQGQRVQQLPKLQFIYSSNLGTGKHATCRHTFRLRGLTATSIGHQAMSKVLMHRQKANAAVQAGPWSTHTCTSPSGLNW